MNKITLRDTYIFGPVKSRRLGISLGVNIMPIKQKVCNFNCIYCECGWNGDSNINEKNKTNFPPPETIYQQLEEVLTKSQNIKKLDTITFSGNGEPTLHPKFSEIIDNTIKLRNKFAKNTKISVLSNATMLHKTNIVSALKKIDNPILKLDSANNNTLQTINLPHINDTKNIFVEKIIHGMIKFNGDFILQIMFLRGEYNGKKIDNTTDFEINGLIEIIRQTKPRQVMIYPIDRETPAEGLIKINNTEMEIIANKIKSKDINVMSV